jgi:hypothetical protein
MAASYQLIQLAAIDIVGLSDDVVGSRTVARNTAMPVRSSAVPMRPKGTASPTSAFFFCPGLVLVFREEGVDAVPVFAVDHAGRDGVHVDAVLIRFSPADWVRLITAALVAQ